MRELLRQLAKRDDPCRYVLYARRRWEEAQLDDRFSWRLIGAPDPLWHLLAARAANRQCGVFLSSNSYLTTWFLRVPAVPIVHDMIPFEPAMRPNLRSTVIERLTLRWATVRSAALICTTETTRRALLARYPTVAGRAVVAPLGATPVPAGELAPEEAERLPAPGFVLAVGTLEPRKNLPRLVAAYRSVEEDLQRRHPLVVVGALGWEAGETLDALRSLRERCIMLGYVSDSALAELYKRCAVFCYPSLGEGFGLPVLEAMAQGAAVLTASVSCLPEVGGEAAEYADPRDVGSIASAMERMLEDEGRRVQLGRLGRERAAGFTWERFAGLTLSTLAEVARTC